MSRVKVPLAFDLEYNYTSNQTIEDLEPQAYMKNCIVSKQGAQDFIVEKRPGYYLYHDFSGVGVEGYGCYYWQNDSTTNLISVTWDGSDWHAYKAAGTSIGTMHGTYHGEANSQCEFAEFYDSALDEILVIKAYSVAAQDHDIWYVNHTMTTVTEITTAMGAPDSTAGDYTVPGVVSMDGYIFVACANGRIFNCNLGDITTWTATDFVSAERYDDTTKFICKHNNNIAVFGDQSIEFFYNASHPGGSPLQRRDDVFYDMGLASYLYFPQSQPIDSNDSLIAFVGNKGGVTADEQEHNGVYIIENFQLRKISTPAIDKLVDGDASVRIIDGRDRAYITVTMKETIYDTYYYNYVYDTSSGLWYYWDIEGAGAGIKGAHSNWFITYEGKVYYDNQHNNVYRYNDGNASAGYTVITSTIVTPDWDGGTPAEKYINETMLVGQFSDASAADNIAVSWSDDSGQNFNTARNIDQRYFRPLHRCGRTRRRRWKLVHSSDNNIILNYMELRGDITDSSTARDT